jgi:hypothetical protein
LPVERAVKCFKTYTFKTAKIFWEIIMKCSLPCWPWTNFKGTQRIMRFRLLRHSFPRTQYFTFLVTFLMKTLKSISLRHFLELHCRDLVRSISYRPKCKSPQLNIERNGATTKAYECLIFNGLKYVIYAGLTAWQHIYGRNSMLPIVRSYGSVTSWTHRGERLPIRKCSRFERTWALHHHRPGQFLSFCGFKTVTVIVLYSSYNWLKNCKVIANNNSCFASTGQYYWLTVERKLGVEIWSFR